MSANIDSHGTQAAPSKEQPARRGRDTREGAQDGGSSEQTNNQAAQGDPPHGHVSHGVAYFLGWLHPDTPWDGDVLAKKWAYFEEADDPRPDPAAEWEGDSHPREGQATLGGWSE